MGAAFLEPAARHETLYRAKTGMNNQVAPALRQEEQRIHQIFGARDLTCEHIQYGGNFRLQISSCGLLEQLTSMKAILKSILEQTAFIHQMKNVLRRR